MTTDMENEDKKYCYRYPHPAVTTDCVIFTFHERRLKVLLVRRGVEPFKGSWALPGGFMRIDESAEQCALRELLEETGYHAAYIRQFHTFSAPGRDPRERVVTVAFLALLRWAEVRGGDDAAEAAWMPVDEVPELAFDHAEILRMALESLRREIHFKPVGFELLDREFSMSELQQVYESILGREFDRRNFAKKMRHTGVVEPMDSPSESVHRYENEEQPDCAVSECCDSMVCEPPAYESTASEPPAYESSCQRKAPAKISKRIGRLFRFNPKRYDELKDNDSFEF